MPQDAFGRRGRFGASASPSPVTFDDVRAPDLTPYRPVKPVRDDDVRAPDISTPGGLSQNLQSAGVSRAYAAKQALQLNRRIQGAANNYGSFVDQGRAAEADIVLAPRLGGDTMYSVNRRGTEANADFAEDVRAPIIGGIRADTRIKNEYADVMAPRSAAEIAAMNAQTAAVTGAEGREQGAYNAKSPFMPDREKAEIGNINARSEGIAGGLGEVDQLRKENAALKKQLETRTNAELRNQPKQPEPPSQIDAQLGDLQDRLAYTESVDGKNTDFLQNKIATVTEAGAKPPKQNQYGFTNRTTGQVVSGQATPGEGAKKLDQAAIDSILQEADGDPNKAVEIAKQRGYAF